MRVRNAVVFLLLSVVSSFLTYFISLDDDDSTRYAVPSVTPEQLKEKIKDPSIALVVVVYYSPGCGICRRVLPVFDKSAKSMESHTPKIFFCRMDTWRHLNHAFENNIQSLPAMYAYDNEGNVHISTDIALKVPTVVNWIKPMLLDDYVIKSSDDIDRCLHDNDIVVIGLFQNKEQNKVFKETAARIDGLIFSSSVDESVSKDVAAFLEKHHEHKCEVVDIGPSKTNRVSMTLPMEGLDCSENPVNLQHPFWTDSFEVTVTGTSISVTRTDKNDGWLQKLQLRCCVHLSKDDHKNEPISISVPSVVMFTNYKTDKFNKYNGKMPFTVEELTTFVKSHRRPVVSYLQDETLATLSSLDMRVAVLFIHKENYNKDIVAKAEEAFTRAAKQFHRAKIAAFIAKDRFNRLEGFATFANADEDAPCIRVIDPTGEQKARKYSFTGDVTSTRDILEFEDKIQEGKIPSMVKSEPVPEEPEDDHAPVVLVGSTYARITRDPKNDVFVVIYASWCGHCRMFMPTWEKLAASLAEEKNIIIGKLDGTANEIEDYEIEGFPTVLLYPAQERPMPIPYEGERSVEALTRFLHREAKNKFTARSEKEIEELREKKLAQKREKRQKELDAKQHMAISKHGKHPTKVLHKLQNEDL